MGRLFLVPLLCVLSMQGAAPKGACFPGDSRSVSPAKKHQISYRWEGERHHLYFQKSGKGAPVKLLTFDRSACVHWSPSGDYFALTNYAGSNISTVEIISSEDLSRRVRVSELLPPSAKDLMSGSLHGYLEADSWDRDGLVVWIHGDREVEPREFDLKVRCRFDGSQWTCARMDQD